jgi:ornithine cyclodeaminase
MEGAMLHITDEQVNEHVTAPDAQQVLQNAFTSFGRNHSAVQERVRTQSGDVKLSTLGAVLPEQGVVGAKVYTTIAGQFKFVILLFSALDGRPLATLDAGAITRLRTAATSVIAAKFLANRDARKLALFGAGQQGLEHAIQFCAAFPIEEILLFDPYAGGDSAEQLERQCGVQVTHRAPNEAASLADIVVTASRSTVPLFQGRSIKPGSFIAAIGSSLPYSRELDDDALQRASLVVVDWRQQALQEAGDLVLADPECLPIEKVVDLSQVLIGETARRSVEDVVIYKSVGIGLQDVALAGFAYSQIAIANGSHDVMRAREPN